MPNKRALVTGSGVRLGQAIAVELAGAGYDLALHYHSSPPEATEAVCQQAGARTRSIAGDLRRADEVERACLSALEFLGGLDLLVNGAALYYPTPTLAEAEASWDDLMSLNLRACLRTTLHCQAALSEARGCVVNITDIYARMPLRRHAAYCVSKAGLWALTRSLALDLAPHVRVNAVAPGAILPPAGAPPETEARLVAQIPLGRLGEPRDVARAVLYLAESEFVTGQCLEVEGGRTL